MIFNLKLNAIEINTFLNFTIGCFFPPPDTHAIKYQNAMYSWWRNTSKASIFPLENFFFQRVKTDGIEISLNTLTNPFIIIKFYDAVLEFIEMARMAVISFQSFISVWAWGITHIKVSNTDFGFVSFSVCCCYWNMWTEYVC